MREARSGRAALLLAGAIALTATGCQSLIDQGAALVEGSRPLRTVPAPPPGAVIGCMQALATGTLQGDPGDPSLVWLEAGGERTDLTWPHGFRIRFTPDAEVLAPGGRTVAREGDEMRLGGGTITDNFEICTVEGEDFLNPAP